MTPAEFVETFEPHIKTELVWQRDRIRAVTKLDPEDCYGYCAAELLRAARVAEGHPEPQGLARYAIRNGTRRCLRDLNPRKRTRAEANGPRPRSYHVDYEAERDTRTVPPPQADADVVRDLERAIAQELYHPEAWQAHRVLVDGVPQREIARQQALTPSGMWRRFHGRIYPALARRLLDYIPAALRAELVPPPRRRDAPLDPRLLEIARAAAYKWGHRVSIVGLEPDDLVSLAYVRLADHAEADTAWLAAMARNAVIDQVRQLVGRTGTGRNRLNTAPRIDLDDWWSGGRDEDPAGLIDLRRELEQ